MVLSAILPQLSRARPYSRLGDSESWRDVFLCILHLTMSPPHRRLAICHMDPQTILCWYSLVNLSHLYITSYSLSLHPLTGGSSRADICLPPRFLLNFDGLTQLQTLNLMTQRQLPFKIIKIFKCCPNITSITSWDWDSFDNPDLHESAVKLQELHWTVY